MSNKPNQTNVEETVVITEPPAESSWTKIKNGAKKHSGKIKIACAAAFGAVAYAVVTSWNAPTDETEDQDEFTGSDEETAVIDTVES